MDNKLDRELRRFGLGEMDFTEERSFMRGCLRRKFPFGDWEPELAALAKAHLEAKLKHTAVLMPILRRRAKRLEEGV